jgi:tyrosyl-tRNA synthetase
MSEAQNLDPKVEAEVERQFNILKFGVTEITPEEELKKMLRHSISTNTPLRVKCGIDPTGTDVHLGHTVPYRKMRQFQELGHIGVVIIGDFTAQIGDPTGKNESRQALSREQVDENAKKFMDQVYQIVDRDKTEVHFQSKWFEQATLKDVIGWAAQTTVAKLLSHETFSKRLEDGNPLSLHELFYPMLQGYDSVYVKADVELGGSDQKFNVLMGRDYQKNSGQRPQVAMLLPIITGTCGTQKMSKSLNNYIGILDEPFDKFGKVMSISDDVMVEYYKYVSGLDEQDFLKIEQGLKNGSVHPNIAKKDLAQMIVSYFHGDDIGRQMREKFESVFAKGKVPDDAPEYELKGESILTILVNSSLFKSSGEVRRMFKQNAVGIVDGEKISDMDLVLGDEFKGKTIKIGKRKFIKLV